LVSGHGLDDAFVLGGPVVLGLALQVVVALGLALLLAGLTRAIEWVRRRGLPLARAISVRQPTTDSVFGASKWFTPRSMRGPPALV
jgi:hypothetical protein